LTAEGGAFFIPITLEIVHLFRTGIGFGSANFQMTREPATPENEMADSAETAHGSPVR
jgi:hypothetical protein